MGLVLGTLFGVGILTCAASLRGEAPTTGLPHWMREIFLTAGRSPWPR